MSPCDSSLRPITIFNIEYDWRNENYIQLLITLAAYDIDLQHINLKHIKKCINTVLRGFFFYL